MRLLAVNTDELTLYFDTDQGVRYIIYGDQHSDELVQRVFCWTMHLYNTVGAETVRGAVADYRKITQFEPGILRNLRRRSHVIDHRHSPQDAVAFVVGNLAQEQMARLIIHMSELNHACVVSSVEEALAYIDSVHAPQECTIW